MKIKDDIKGINKYQDEFEYYNQNSEELEEEAQIALIQEKQLDDFFQKQEEAKLKWDLNAELNLKELINYQIISYENSKKGEEPNFIGQRINYLLKSNNQTISEFCRVTSISRSSMHRYLNGTHVPSQKTLKKIIKGLMVTVGDFSFAPTDFNMWKSSLEDSEGNDIFEFKNTILKTLCTKNFTYNFNGTKKIVPNKNLIIFKSLIENAFEIFDLFPHD